ncbi:MAG: lactonase family protein [Verrucomicrobia bacterium]|nr:MAG: lactonase family protein [Verrucomicrobiota bacterium]
MILQLRNLWLVITLVIGLGSVAMGQTSKSELFVYVGTYNRGDEGGIRLLRFSPDQERLEYLGLAGECSNPSFIAIHPNGRSLYAVSERGSPEGGQILSFSVDRGSGLLTALNERHSGGKGPCHLVVDPSGGWVLVANYSDGGVATLRILDDGSLGEGGARLKHEGSGVDPERQEGPHAHSINLTPDGSRAVVADLGTDKVVLYRFDPGDGSLIPNDPPWGTVDPGSGPRHVAFHPDGNRVYVLNEMSATLSTFSYDPASGALEPMQTVPMLPDGFDGTRSGAEVVVHPSGRFVYASNRGHDSIAIFGVLREDGTLVEMGHEPSGGKSPRNIAIDPSGTYLFAANQNTNNVVVFRIEENGQLSRTAMEAKVPRPVCLRFLAVD